MFEIGAKLEDTGWSSQSETKTPQKHCLYFAKEKRRGKVVTIAKPFYLEKTSMQERLKVLKKS